MENKIYILFDFQNQPVEVNLVIDELQKFGKVLGGRAYASWSKHRFESFALYNYGIELVEIPEADFLPNKKGNDIRLSIDAVELALSNHNINTFVLVSGDADFSALVYRLKSLGKSVYAIARLRSSSYELISSVDKFIPYEDLVKNEKYLDPIDRLSKDVDVFLKRTGKTPNVDTIIKIISALNIAINKYSFEGIEDLAKEIYKRIVEKPERDKDIRQQVIKALLFYQHDTLDIQTISKFLRLKDEEVKSAIEHLANSGILKVDGERFEIVRNRKFFETLLEMYPVHPVRLSQFVEKVYKVFSSGRVTKLESLNQSEFRIPSSEFRTYLEALKRSGCFVGKNESDYISYATEAKIVCEKDELLMKTFAFFVKRIFAQTFVYENELEFIRDIIFGSDSEYFQNVLNYLLENDELEELERVYYYIQK